MILLYDYDYVRRVAFPGVGVPHCQARTWIGVGRVISGVASWYDIVGARALEYIVTLFEPFIKVLDIADLVNARCKHLLS